MRYAKRTLNELVYVHCINNAIDEYKSHTIIITVRTHVDDETAMAGAAQHRKNTYGQNVKVIAPM